MLGVWVLKDRAGRFRRSNYLPFTQILDRISIPQPLLGSSVQYLSKGSNSGEGDEDSPELENLPWGEMIREWSFFKQGRETLGGPPSCLPMVTGRLKRRQKGSSQWWVVGGCETTGIN